MGMKHNLGFSGLALLVFVLSILLFLPQPPKAYNCPNNEQAWCCIGGGSGACGFACPSGWTCGSRWDSSGQGRDTWWFCVVCKDTDFLCSAITYCIPPVTVPTPIPSFQSVYQGQTAYIYDGGPPSGGTGTYPSYQWLEEAPGQSTFSAASCTSQTYAYCYFGTSSSTTPGYYYFEEKAIDSQGNSGVSSSVTVQVLSPPLIAGAITPSSPTINSGQSLTLTPHPSGGNPPYLLFFWYSGTYPNCAQDTYLFAVLPFVPATVNPTSNTYYCYTVYDSSFNSATSPTDYVTVILPSLTAGAPTPTSPSIDNGQSITLTANPSGGSGSYTSYQWFSGSSCTTTITGATSSTYTASPTQNTYYCYKVIDSASNSATSPADLVTVNAALVAGAVTPSSPTINNGQSITLYANPSGGTPSYHFQWFSGLSYSTCTTIISGATSSTVSVSPSTNTYYCYEVSDSSSAGAQTAISSADFVTVIPVLVAGPITPASPTINPGQSVLLTAHPSGGTQPYSYVWYSGLSSSTCTIAISGAISQTYSASPTQNTYYCYKVTDSSGPSQSQTSVTDLVTVVMVLSIANPSPSSQTVFLTQTGTINDLGASGGTAPYTYQWLEQPVGSGSFSNAVDCGAGNAPSSTVVPCTFATTPTTPTGTYNFELRVTDSLGATMTSTTAQIVVEVPPPVAIPNTCNYGYLDKNSWIEINLFVVLAGLLIASLIYVLAGILPTRSTDRLRGVVKAEYVEAVMSVLIIAAIISLVSLGCTISALLTGMNPFVFATYFVGDLLFVKGINLMTQIYTISTQFAVDVYLINQLTNFGFWVAPILPKALTQYAIKKIGPIEIAIGLSGDAGIVFDTYGSAITALSLLVILTFGTLLMQFLFIPIISGLALTVVVPLAIVIRSLVFLGPRLREAADSFLTLAVALYFVYPLAFVMDATIISWLYCQPAVPFMPAVYPCNPYGPLNPTNNYVGSYQIVTISPSSLFSSSQPVNFLGISSDTLLNPLNIASNSGLPFWDVILAPLSLPVIVQSVAQYMFEGVALMTLNLTLTIGFAIGVQKGLSRIRQLVYGGGFWS